MILITIEINGFQQLMQAERHLTERISSHIEEIFENTGFQKKESKSGLSLYECGEDQISLSRVVDILHTLHMLLQDNSEEIPGITVLMQKSGFLKRGTQQHSGVNSIFLLPEEDGVWCTGEAVELISHFVSCSEIDGYFRINDFHRNTPAITKVPEIFHPGDILDRLIDHVFDMVQGKTHRIPVLAGPAGSGKRLIIDTLFRMVESKNREQAWLELNKYQDIGPDYLPLLQSIDQNILKSCAYTRNRYEKEIQTDLDGLFEIPYRAWTNSDAVLCFLNFLEAYRIRMNTELFPPIIVIHGIDEIDQANRDFLLELLVRNSHSQDFIPLLTIRGEQKASFFPSQLQSELFFIREWIEQLSSKCGKPLSSPYQIYMPDPSSSGPAKAQDDMEAPLRILMESLEQVQRVFYCCAVLQGLLEKPDLLQLCSRIGIGKDEAEQCLYQLESLGLLTGAGRYFVVDKDLSSKMKPAISIDYRVIDTAVEEVVLLQPGKHEFCQLVETAKRINFTDGGWLKIYRLLFDHLLSDMVSSSRKTIESTVDLLEKKHPLLDTLILLMVHMGSGDMLAATRYYSALFAKDVESTAKGEPESWVRVLLTYAEGEFLWRRRDEKDKVLKKVKQALLQVQEESFPELESRAIILLGKVMLTNNRVNEASEYFRQARQKTFDTGLHSAACESIALTALTYFLTGDYSLSYSHALASEQKAHATGRREWERYAMMLRARIQFELGRYREADVLFQELLSLDRLYFEGAKHDYFVTWLARTYIYQGYIQAADAILSMLKPTPESLLFQAEAELLNRNLDTAQAYVQKALLLLEDESSDILPIEALPVDGFEAYENLSLKIPGVYNVIRQILYSLSGFCLSEMGKYEDSEEAFEKLFSQERISRQDPYRHLYYYFRTVTLPAQGEREELNMLTYLSKAFQSLQKISGRISDPSDRRSYTSQNYWNSKLFNLSRHYKLV